MSKRPFNYENVLRVAQTWSIPVLSVLFVVGSAAAAEQAREPDLEMGARLVEARCIVCHRQQFLPELVDRCAKQHGQAYLDDFLKRHHAPDDVARADIIAYLTCPPALLPTK